MCVCVAGGGGGGRGGGGGEVVREYEHKREEVVREYEHKSRHIFYTRHIVTTYSTEPYSFMKIILRVFKIESIAA